MQEKYLIPNLRTFNNTSEKRNVYQRLETAKINRKGKRKLNH